MSVMSVGVNKMI